MDAGDLRQAADEIMGIADSTLEDDAPPLLVAAVTLARAWLAANPADSDEPVTEEWLVKEMKAIQEEDEFFLNGLALTRWGDDWRWQVGGSENMWELLHKPTRGTIRQFLSLLGFPLPEPA